MNFFFISSARRSSGYMGMPSGYPGPESSAGYRRSSMNGIWVAVKQTTRYSGLDLKQVLKLWKSRPAAPIMMMFFCFIVSGGARVVNPNRE